MRVRRGSHAILFAFSLVVVLAAAMLAMDTAWIVVARSQAQDAADAGSQAAVIVLRQTGDPTRARQAAERIVAANRIVGVPAKATTVTFGRWSQSGWGKGTFLADPVRPSAVRVEVLPEGGVIPLLLGPVFGFHDQAIRATAISSARSLQFLLVVDITGSWGEKDFAKARQASLLVLDRLRATHGPDDEIGMVLFSGRWGWEYTPLTRLSDSAAIAAVRTRWSKLNIASKAGKDTNPLDGAACKLHPTARKNDFSDPLGGCYPDMPREYTDESGTDHAVGLEMAKTMWLEGRGGGQYRAMLVLTDGKPGAIASGAGSLRAADGFVDTRWRNVVGPAPRSVDQVRTASIAASNAMWNDLRVHSWVVSLVAEDTMLTKMVQGDGWFLRTSNPADLGPLFEQVISELPLPLVE